MEWIVLILLICIGSHLFMHMRHSGNGGDNSHTGTPDHSGHNRSKSSHKNKSGSCH